MNLREIGWYGMDWIVLAQRRDQWSPLVNTVMKLCLLYLLKYTYILHSVKCREA
jgi:hypothetical protein